MSDPSQPLAERLPELLLAIESATARLSVALLLSDGSIVEREPEAPGQHAERILPLIDALLRDAGHAPDDVNAFAVSIGPGSFTSLRVGLATAKGLAFGRGTPIVPVPTLEALALGACLPGDDRPVAAILDARRGEAYAAVFQPEGDGLRILQPDGLFAPDELAAVLPKTCRLTGEGARLLGDELRERAGDGIVLPGDEDADYPRAGCVARLGRGRLVAQAIGNADLAPRYVRRAEAEVTRTKVAVEDPS